MPSDLPDEPDDFDPSDPDDDWLAAFLAAVAELGERRQGEE
jgi:hypothetical protein